MNFIEILAYYTVSILSVTAIIGYIAKSLFSTFLASKLELYKQELVRENEIFKSTLAKDSYEYQVKFSKLHAERAETIKLLYTHFVSIRKLFDKLLSKASSDSETITKEELHEIDTLVFKTIEVYELNKLFFSAKMNDKIKNFLTVAGATNILFSIHEFAGNKYEVYRKGQENGQALNKADFVQYMDSDGALNELEIEFKKLIGVE